MASSSVVVTTSLRGASLLSCPPSPPVMTSSPSSWVAFFGLPLRVFAVFTRPSVLPSSAYTGACDARVVFVFSRSACRLGWAFAGDGGCAEGALRNRAMVLLFLRLSASLDKSIAQMVVGMSLVAVVTLKCAREATRPRMFGPVPQLLHAAPPPSSVMGAIAWSRDKGRPTFQRSWATFTQESHSPNHSPNIAETLRVPKLSSELCISGRCEAIKPNSKAE